MGISALIHSEELRKIRTRIYGFIESSDLKPLPSRIYDCVMMVAIFCSLLPLATHSNARIFLILDIIPCCLFIVDYLLRWFTADIATGQKGLKPFLLYPFSPMAIVDLLSILPTLSAISEVFKVLRISRLFRIFRILKFVRYSEPLQILITVIKKDRRTLLAVLGFAISYILICALVMFNVESDPSFSTFYDAIYWACCTLTTVGYGDIIPISAWGRAFSMLSAIVGIALVALPSGIITSGYMEELKIRKEKRDQKDSE